MPRTYLNPLNLTPVVTFLVFHTKQYQLLTRFADELGSTAVAENIGRLASFEQETATCLAAKLLDDLAGDPATGAFARSCLTAHAPFDTTGTIRNRLDQ